MRVVAMARLTETSTTDPDYFGTESSTHFENVSSLERLILFEQSTV